MSVLPSFATMADDICYTAGYWSGAQSSKSTIQANLLYTNVQGSVVSGETILPGTYDLNPEYSGGRSENSLYQFPTFVGYNYNSAFTPLDTKHITTTLDYYSDVPADITQTSQTIDVLKIAAPGSNKATIHYKFSTDLSLAFVGTFGSFSDDVIQPLKVQCQPTSTEYGHMKGTYYINDYNANDENGKQKYHIIEWSHYMRTDYDNVTGMWSLDPYSQGAFYTNDNIDWLFVGSFVVWAPGGVSLVAEYTLSTGVYSTQYHYELRDVYENNGYINGYDRKGQSILSFV